MSSIEQSSAWLADRFRMRRYRVIGECDVFDHKPGETFYRDLTGAERLLIGSHIVEIPDAPDDWARSEL